MHQKIQLTLASTNRHWFFQHNNELRGRWLLALFNYLGIQTHSVFFNSLSLSIDFPLHVCDFLVTRWLLCQASEVHSRQKMWPGKGKRESTEPALTVPLPTIKARVFQEAPSIILHWYFSDKIYFTWPLLHTSSSKKLFNSLPSFYRRRQD